MKKILFIILILVSILLVSCADKDQTADEIIKYYNDELIPINNFKDNNIGKYFNEFKKLDSQNDKIKATELIETEIIPANEELILQIESVDTKNKKTKKMNNLKLKAEKHVLESFKDLIKYYDGEINDSELAKVKEKQDLLYDEIIDYQKKVFDKYDLELSSEKIGDYKKLVKNE